MGLCFGAQFISKALGRRRASTRHAADLFGIPMHFQHHDNAVRQFRCQLDGFGFLDIAVAWPYSHPGKQKKCG
jgi:hypothetical protein